jgi:hypothetical protein
MSISTHHVYFIHYSSIPSITGQKSKEKSPLSIYNFKKMIHTYILEIGIATERVPSRWQTKGLIKEVLTACH